MLKMGLEPTRHECHKILSLARLPIPTLPQTIEFQRLNGDYYSTPGAVRQY